MASNNSSTSKQLLSAWGLPQPILEAFHKKGLRQLYPWQAAALECAAAGNNLVYTAPTSGVCSCTPAGAQHTPCQRLRAKVQHSPCQRFARNQHTSCQTASSRLSVAARKLSGTVSASRVRMQPHAAEHRPCLTVSCILCGNMCPAPCMQVARAWSRMCSCCPACTRHSRRCWPRQDPRRAASRSSSPSLAP
jgi:hypothetical protein